MPKINNKVPKDFKVTKKGSLTLTPRPLPLKEAETRLFFPYILGTMIIVIMFKTDESMTMSLK